MVAALLRRAAIIMIKVTKFGEDWLNGFLAMEEKLGDGSIPPPPPPIPNKVKCIFTFILQRKATCWLI